MKRLLVLPALFLLAACASTKHNAELTNAVILDHRADYASAQNGRDLVIRPPLSDYLVSHQFDIPR